MDGITATRATMSLEELAELINGELVESHNLKETEYCVALHDCGGEPCSIEPRFTLAIASGKTAQEAKENLAQAINVGQGLRFGHMTIIGNSPTSSISLGYTIRA